MVWSNGELGFPLCSGGVHGYLHTRKEALARKNAGKGGVVFLILLLTSPGRVSVVRAHRFV